MSDDAPWVAARAKAAPGFVVLRPTWLPRPPDAASKCEMDSQRLEDASSEEYHVRYGRVVPGWPYFTMNDCSIVFGGHANWFGLAGRVPNEPPAPLATFTSRGNVVYIRESGPGAYLFLWVENGAIYEVVARGYELSDLIRAVNSLEPVR